MVEGLAERVSAEGGYVVLIRDCVACKGSFLLHYLLKKLLIETNTRVLMLGLAEPLSHYARIAGKHGCNLKNLRDSGRFVYFEEPQLLKVQRSASDGGTNPTFSSDNPLAEVYFKIREAARGKKVPDTAKEVGVQTCIMIDDASILDVIAGGNHNFVLDFLHYCRALKVGGQRCSVVLLTHQDVYEEPPVSYMSLQLDYAADTVLTVEPLSSGHAVDVHGQVTILHRTNEFLDQRSRMKSKSMFQKYQFRILENTVQLFRPG